MEGGLGQVNLERKALWRGRVIEPGPVRSRGNEAPSTRKGLALTGRTVLVRGRGVGWTGRESTPKGPLHPPCTSPRPDNPDTSLRCPHWLLASGTKIS